MISHETPCICPHCGIEHELASEIFGEQKRKPTGGSVSLCIRCGKASVFDSNLQLRLPTAEEAALIAVDPRITEARIVMAGMVPAKGEAT